MNRSTTLSESAWKTHRTTALVALIALVALLAACAPRALGPGGQPANELQRTAQLAFHRMQIAYLETGNYTTNALVDLDLPRGVKWTLEEFSTSGYRLRFTDDKRPGEAWLVTPGGVTPAPNA